MKLYFMKHAVATEETGPFNPQIEDIFPKQQFDSDQSIYRLFDSFHEFPKKEPKIDFALLKKGSNMTDILSASMLVMLGFLINSKLRLILENFRLPEHNFYWIPVKFRNETHNYYWLHMLYKYKGFYFEDVQSNNIVFEKSEFVIEKHLSKISDISINSKQDFITKNANLPISKSIKANSLVLNETFLKLVPDIFNIPLLGTNWIVREDLRDRIIQEKITGVELTEINNISC